MSPRCRSWEGSERNSPNPQPAYAARDAGFALADLAYRTGRREEASARYRELLEVTPEGPVREFCRSRL